ncbi:hypothetical protein I302_102208 [Kwoniella bestiolae CBS 10118]|uniref:Uncharacterized protein n=1 Tax=Kwoniella bestiolae CBS 10118 TaxID=1296100 RepID=A0A1B9GEA7_9TREE|nr:hypothetical protein I302_00897 [Kwoniella bestiolae CBS 10118]OCF29393.1 hypothetical protein I302_00897 [Kwoniella bestiolae CBS 10118]
MAPTAGPSNQKQPAERKRKAGGSGKKGKVFVEDKKDLLSLMSSITSSKDAMAESKITKRKAALEESETSVAEEKSRKSRKSVEKEEALERAKASLLEKQRLKKSKKSSSNASGQKQTGSADQPKKKKVGFA